MILDTYPFWYHSIYLSFVYWPFPKPPLLHDRLLKSKDVSCFTCCFIPGSQARDDSSVNMQQKVGGWVSRIVRREKGELISRCTDPQKASRCLHQALPTKMRRKYYIQEIWVATHRAVPHLSTASCPPLYHLNSIYTVFPPCNVERVMRHRENS